MFISLIFSSFTVLILSYGIAFLSKFILLKDATPNEYLFGHNNTALATFSNIGSILSITLIISGIFPAIFGWGYTPIYGLYIGIVIGYVLFIISGRRIHRLVKLQSSCSEFETKTLLVLVDSSSCNLFRVSQILLYTLALSLELAVLKFVLKGIFYDSGVFAFIILGIIVLLCATYTSVGGYSGVLRTDLFQLLIYIVGPVYFIIDARKSIFDSIQNTWRPEYYIPDDLWLFVGSLFLVIAYHFAWPDLWVRNVGTLYSDKRLKLNSIKIGGLGLILVTIPIVLLALPILSESANETLTKSVDISHVINHLVKTFRNSFELQQKPILLWWLFGSVICVFITTIDTWLIGINQHLKQHFAEKYPYKLKLLPYLFSIVAFIISFFVHKQVFYIVALVMLIILFSNSMILLLSNFPLNRVKSIKSYLTTYYLLCTPFTLIMAYYYFDKLSSKAHFIIIYQVLLSFIVLFIIPLLVNWLSRKG